MKLLYAEDEPERRRYSLSGAVTDAAEQYREPAESAGLGLGVAVEPGIEHEGSPEAAAELMGILLDNAVKYAEPGTEIGVTLRREGGSLSARVKPGGTIEFEARWKIART